MSLKLKNNRERKKPFLASTLVTLLIVAMLIISGPAQAVQVLLNADNLNNLKVGETGFFYVNVTIGANERIPIANITVENLPDIPGSPGGKLVFNVSDIPAVWGYTVKENYNITLIERYGWVNGTGGSGNISNEAVAPYYGYGYGYSFTGFGYGYGYAYGGGNPSTYTRFKYKVTVNTAGALAGTYNVVSKVNTGQGVAFQGAASFTLIPANIPVTIDILKEKINPGSNEEIKVAILSTASFNASALVNPSSVRFGPSGATEKPPYNKTDDVNSDGLLDLVISFKMGDTGIKCGDTSATLTGKTYAGQNITGSDTFTTLGCSVRRDDSSSGSTGGGVTTPEPIQNIAKHETRDCNVLSGKPSSCKFSVPEHWVSELVVTGKENELVTFRIEALKGLSSKVPVPAIGTQYLNIWPDSRRVQEALIRFRVENSWIASEGLTSENLRMYRWDGTKWNELETRVLSKDASATNYEAKTDAFAYFAITGPKAATGKGTETTAAPTVTAPGGKPSSTATAPTEAQEPISLVYIIILIGVIAVVAYLYAATQKKK